jgi:hypothetical protein
MPRISLDPNFREFLELLNSAEVKYLLLGGYAVNYHGYHRFTGDLDVWIAVSAENAQRVSRVLQTFGFPATRVPPSMFLETGKIFMFGRVPVRIDLLTAPSGVEFNECYARRVEANLDGLRVPIISLEDLKANKLASGRDKDLLDLKYLPATPGASAASSKVRKPRRGGRRRK